MSAKPEVIIEDNPAALASAATDIFTGASRDSIKERGVFTAALSGGSTPRAAHRLLGEEPYLSSVSWARTHLFWVDDRCVPVSSAASNYGAAKQDFLDQIPIPASQVHPMPVDAVPEEGARLYHEELREFFQTFESGFPIFDLILLGVGKDGHIASLFPGQRALEEKNRWVIAVKGGDPNVYRLTLTLPVINRARQIVFLVTGQEKAEIVRTIIESGQEFLPAQRIKPRKTKPIWLLDRPAASTLSGQ
ncbi:MAG: 6-phosphogluconolactonase [Deltaproteobacteria bacterium]|nr:6-phosphogluconolactonase [Deltaproteobacteria bacterium]MBW2052393.1 6-phosphogluconolactonase [Deltaproteobacteria bacterium]MBW2141473.1 6-phosphogluconolactonase [Deltaproteobacteria bacterium]MBW2323109.1 6-phosphogluconolactonase [Deltaproteobacteria bacterium]